MKNFTLFLSMLILFSCTMNNQPDNSVIEPFPALKGPYLGQQLPDTVPVLFAPEIVNTGMFTRDVAIPPSGDEIYFCVAIGNYTFSTILYSRLDHNGWTRPEVVSFATSGKVIDFEPAFSPDGERLYFLSARPAGAEEPGDQDIWYVDRDGELWGDPVNPGPPVNTDGGEFFPSLTKDGYLYFTHNDKGSGLNEIFRSKIYADSFGIPEKLPQQVNCGTNRFNAFVSPNHDYIILPVLGMEDAFDQVDYYITFRNEKDQWSKPVNLGAAVNKDNTRGWSPYVSPDGNYFFFMSNKSAEIPAGKLTYDKIRELYNSPGNGNSDIYWMKADFIGKLKEEAVFEN